LETPHIKTLVTAGIHSLHAPTFIS